MPVKKEKDKGGMWKKIDDSGGLMAKKEGLLITDHGVSDTKVALIEGKDAFPFTCNMEDFKWLGDWQIVYLKGYPVEPCIIWRVGTLKELNDDGENIYIGTYTIGGKKGVTILNDEKLKVIMGKMHTTFLMGCQLMSKLNSSGNSATLMILPNPPSWMLKELEEKGCKTTVYDGRSDFSEDFSRSEKSSGDVNG